MASSWRVVLNRKDDYVNSIHFDALIMKDQYMALMEYSKQCCNSDLNLALQKCLFFGINDTLEKYAQTKETV